MSMSGHEVHSCEVCGASDYDCFMVKRVLDKQEEFWFCKECDPGEELKPESLYDTASEARGER